MYTPGRPPSVKPNNVGPHAVSTPITKLSCLSTAGAFVTLLPSAPVFVEMNALNGVAKLIVKETVTVTVGMAVFAFVGGQEVPVHGGKGRYKVTE